MGYYSTSSAFLEALGEAGVRYIFANLGSDHPGIIEALAQAKSDGTSLPKLIVCPHETVALSAAHAYAAVAREPQAVLVHVDAGTQNLGGAVNNAMRGRVPVLIFAGAAPFTLNDELPAGRNEFIHWIQDVHDQRGILRGYVKYDNEIRSGRNVKQLVHRALQLARSEPAGPVYLVGPRETMEEPVEPYDGHPEQYSSIAPAALTDSVASEIAIALAEAENPLIITSYLGRDPSAVPVLAALAEELAIPVIESAAFCVNLPADHPMHRGWQFTTRQQNPLLAAADVILTVDSDVPWISHSSKPSPDARIYSIDVDPLKADMSMFHIGARRYAAANSRVALGQLLDRARGLVRPEVVAARRVRVSAEHDAQRAGWEARERPSDDGTITPQYLTACVRDAVTGLDPLFLTEAITNYQVVAEHLRVSRPGGLFGSGGGSLGWAGGGVVGAKLAAPDRTVVALVGDGSYLFGVPASAQWVARRYGTPALTVIYDNRGWRAPKQSTLGVHPAGAAASHDEFGVSFEPEVDLPGVAVACGAFGATVSAAVDLPGTLKDALAAVADGRSAVISVHIPPVTGAGPVGDTG
jgi:acetolactate synthase I/II/III large subunit